MAILVVGATEFVGQAAALTLQQGKNPVRGMGTRPHTGTPGLRRRSG